MGVYVDGKLVYTVDGDKLNTTLSLGSGKQNTVVQEWDYCGGSTYTPVTVTVSSKSGIFVTSPANNSTISSPANYVATATTATCSKGIGSMGVYVNNKLITVQDGAGLNAQVSLGTGAQNTVVQEWDRCGGSSYVPVKVTVKGSERVLSNLEKSGGWDGWGQLPPDYKDCAPCSGIAWTMWQGVSAPSTSDKVTQFNTHGTKPYAVVLWYNPVIGTYSTQGLPDDNHTLVPSLHNFTYDTEFYVTNKAITQALEFDVSMYMDGIGMFWGTQCSPLGDGDWDVLDNVTQKWASTGVACKLVNGWNHLTLQLQRESGNTLLYKSITLNGATANINKTYAPFKVSPDWYGITVNYQMDGDSKQAANTTYLNNLSLTYW
ncbi:MAG TPA: hypothetical protein VGG56_17170 [Terracidiphilus sp.]|jgi:hypothetical protein